MFIRYLPSLCIFVLARPSFAITSYADEFIAPDYFLTPSKWSPEASQARAAIVNGAQDLASQAPWSEESLPFRAYPLLTCINHDRRDIKDDATTKWKYS